MSVTYLHRGEHPAFTVEKRLERGQVIPAPIWPEAKPGDEMRCGTCGELLMTTELNERALPLARNQIES